MFLYLASFATSCVMNMFDEESKLLNATDDGKPLDRARNFALEAAHLSGISLFRRRSGHTELLDRGSASWRRRDEDYLGFASELAESLRAMDNGPVIFNT